MTGSRGGGGGGGAEGAVNHEVLSRSPERLKPQEWTRIQLETSRHGHFEAVESRTGGGFNMAFAGMDTASHRQGFDFDPQSSFTKTATGRVREVDAEFPIGKRVGSVYPQNIPSAKTTRHVVPHTIYDYKGGSDKHFHDKELLDTVRPIGMGAQPANSHFYGVPQSPRLGVTPKMGDQPLPDTIKAQSWAGHIIAVGGGAGVTK